MSQLVIHTYSEGEPNFEYVGEPRPDVIELDWGMFSDEWGNYGPEDFAEGRRTILTIEDQRVRDRILREWDQEIADWHELNNEPGTNLEGNIVVGHQDDLIQAVQAPPRRPHPNRPPPKTLHSITP